MAATDEFPITYVTPRFHRLVKGLEGAVMAFEKAGDDFEKRTEAWSAVSVAREALYHYAQELERMNRKINKKRTVALRF